MTGSSHSLGKLPGYLLHADSGLARVRVNGKYVYIGKYNSPESRKRYGELIADMSSGLELDPLDPGDGEAKLTINELILGYPPLTLCPIAHHAATVQWSKGKAASLAQVWPMNPAPFFAAGAVAIVKDLETTNNEVRHLPEFLPPLFDSQAPFSEMAQLLLAVSLLAKSADLRGLAVDALIAVMADGRCGGPELGTIFRRLLPSGIVRANRLFEAFNTASRSSPRHLRACSQTVQSMFSEIDVIPDDAHHLLTPLLDWVTELRQPLEPPFRAVLSTVAGSGKTAKLARSLLTL